MTEEHSHLVHFCYCRYVIKYLMHDMMKYHCLRVLRSHVRRLGKDSAPAEHFGTRMHGVK